MTVRIVTDSSSDIPADLAQELGITIVPLYVRFGEEVFRDRVELSEEKFYQRMEEDPTPPITSQPSPGDFAQVYQELSQETDEIVSIHISSKVSGTCNSALRGKDATRRGCHIEVIDSSSVSMGLGLITMAAAKAAQMGENMQRVMQTVRQSIPHTHIFGLFDTLKYLARGGRIGKAKGLLGAVLNVKPLLTMRDGEICPMGLARTRSRGLERLLDLAKGLLSIQDLAIVHSTSPDEAKSFAQRLISLVNRKDIHIARLGPALGAHGGPGTLLLALRQAGEE
jgi:DegV family protein with EDD domain